MSDHATQWPGRFHSATRAEGATEDYLAPHRALDRRDVPEINAYAPSQVNRVIFHELDADLDPSGTAYIEATRETVVNTEDHR